jgi:LysR family nitrogen assimilation transcriptional regulator
MRPRHKPYICHNPNIGSADVDIRGLRYFIAVAEFGSYSRAAEFLRISQPAISRQIRQLEQELGRSLFVRHGHGVGLSDAGRVLLARSQVVLRQLDQARDEIRSGGTGPSGTVTLALPPAAGHFLVPTLARRFAAAYPNVFLKIIGGYSGAIHEWLVRGQVDLACIHDPLPQRGFEVVPLIREPVFLVGRPGSFPGQRGHVTAADLARLPLILTGRPNASRRLLDGWMAREGLTPNVRMEIDDPSITRAVLREGLGFSLLSQGSFLADARLGELEARPFRPAIHWELALIRAAETHPDPIALALMAMIRTTVRDLSAAGAWLGELVANEGRG